MQATTIYWTTIIVIYLAVSCECARYVPKWKKQACELPSAHSEQSHYVCDDDGDVKCLPGWTGDLCDVPKCRPGCDPMNGYCNRPGECLCKLGYYGAKCNKCIRLPGCQHGFCTASFQCICHDGWDGLFCSEPLCKKECHSTRGYCEMPGECQCRLGWSGKYCRDCQILPGCQHGYCEKPLECKCRPGYTGILCQTPTCAKSCHKERGYCRKPGECRCKVGWWGDNCDKCYPYPGCVNGNCTRPWECRCFKGWGGILCDEELNFCELNPDTCQNGGKCVSMLKDEGSFKCRCREGTAGRYCEIVENHSMVGTIVSNNSTSISSMVHKPPMVNVIPTTSGNLSSDSTVEITTTTMESSDLVPPGNLTVNET